ncbi:MAG: hypothetical protein IJ557_02450 [Bacteroidaceae bacterium]|nr:hypothetical protein [Bacteroidaceae bacterium]
MKTSEEMHEQFNELYNLMATSNNVAFMRTFGTVHHEMMSWFIANKPELADEWLCKLESIRWNNYLTAKESESIVASMLPKAPWSRDAWKQTLDKMGIVLEEAPYYNDCALWTTMNMIYSDSSKTIANILSMPLEEIPAETMVKTIHALALDKLKDVDHRFNIRTYFGL